MVKMGNIIEGVFGLCAAVYFTLYLTWKLKYSEANEKKRKERIQKYGWILVPITIFAYFFSIALILLAF